MTKKEEVMNGESKIGYLLGIIALILGFFLAKKYYAFILLWGIVPFPVSLGDRYIWLLDEPELRMKSLILGVISISITLVFLRKIYISKESRKQLKLGVISLIISILFFFSFYVIAPSYIFKTYPELFMYMDSKGEYIEKPGYYFWLVDKLGFYQETYRPFQTLDDAIQGLEFAKEKKQGGLYSYIFWDLQKFGYENIFKKYDDKHFQLYFLYEMIIDLGILNKYLFENNIGKFDIYKNSISNPQVKALYVQFLKEYQQLENKDPNYNQPMSEYQDRMRLRIEDLLKN